VRLEPFTRVWVCLGLAALAAFFLIAKVAPTAVAQMQLDEANSLLARIDEHPNAELITQAEVELRAAVASNAVNGPALTDLAWLWLEWARLDPAQFTRYSQMAESDATRAAAYTPRAPEPWIVRGLACLLANRGADAAAHLNHALEVAPRDPEAQYYATTVLLGDIRPENGPPMLRMLPPRYSPPPPWPPLDGEPAGAVAAPQ
jgi:tetratricopeptide (TPR) repeat protein